MQNNINFREFMRKVEKQLKNYSSDTLREIIITWAKKTPQAKRQEFLAMIIPPSSGKKPPKPDKELLKGIKALSERVEDGDYCDGWGWDNELRQERDWGDESWAEEVDDFFSQANDAFLNGQYELAKQAYKGLFAILAMGEESGHLPGNPDIAEMLTTDIEEALLCYFRAVYMTTSAETRPCRLLESIQGYWYFAGSHFSLQKLIDAGTISLPDFHQFLDALVNFLREKGSHHNLLREAVKLSGGITALAELARREGKEHPGAYVDWLEALDGKNDYHMMAEVAREGLAAVPHDYSIRAEIAEGLIKAGKLLNDISLQLSGYREAFCSSPNLDYFLNLFSLASQNNCFTQEVEAAIAILTSLLQKTGCRNEQYYPIDDEIRMSSVSSPGLLVTIYILTGRYEQAYQLCQNKAALGWTYGINPKGLAIPFFLVLLAGEIKLAATPNLEKLWNEAVDVACDDGSIDLRKHFQQVMDDVFNHIQLPEKDETKYLEWCISEAGLRVGAIVGEKHRQSYHKAANLLVAVAEVLARRERKKEGASLLGKYRQKYPRHRAFREELDAALAISCIYKGYIVSK
ncbi:MAG: hypothetical protein A4E53_04566 [Pelotomaculum sp. PtaB.Bin104]|nr:MAG: hypothetical protein A4E53_04566 [Pelotomaculum sp. PtaB.Bin104]